MSSSRIKKSGHKACINCIDGTTVSRHLVATGSDDKSIRIWDIRADRAIKCIAQCFELPIEAVKFSVKEENTMYAASGKSLFTFDLRTEGIIIKNPIMASCTAATDDINSITIKPGGDYLAVADDGGMITIVDAEKLNVYMPRRLRGHTSLVSAVAFSPLNANTLVSGGFDYLLNSWDLGTTADTPVTTVNVTQLGQVSEEFSTKSINPPYVQSISYVCGGRGVVVALGDGSLKVVDATDSRKLLAAALDAHAGMVTALFCSGGNTLYSGGIDRSVKCWKLEDNTVPASKVENIPDEENSKESNGQDISYNKDPSKIEDEIKNILSKSKEKLDKEKKAKNKKKKNKRFVGNSYPMKFNLSWDEDHYEKINVICGFRIEDDSQSDKLFVGDVSTELTIYNIG